MIRGFSHVAVSALDKRKSSNDRFNLLSRVKPRTSSRSIWTWRKTSLLAIINHLWKFKDIKRRKSLKACIRESTFMQKYELALTRIVLMPRVHGQRLTSRQRSELTIKHKWSHILILRQTKAQTQTHTLTHNNNHIKANMYLWRRFADNPMKYTNAYPYSDTDTLTDIATLQK